MSSVLLSLPQIFNSYKSWVAKNPQALCDYETSIKWISYFIAGRINNSHVVSELVYCLSNLLVLFNDRIINESWKIDFQSRGDTLKLWLSVIEYSEVFLELSAKKIWGTTGRWLVITAIEIFKCISRFILIYHHKENVIQKPPIPMIDRKNVGKKIITSDLTNGQFSSETFRLKRNGALIRKVDSSPPLNARNWQPVKESEVGENEQIIERDLVGTKLTAEVIYISKPLVHLASMALFGSKTWKPYIISLAMDVCSLQLYKSGTKNRNTLTKEQKLQISRRTIMLVMYLIRSPFYDKYSKNKINAFLSSMSENLPLMRIVCSPLAQYLPFWQSIYFYMWSS